MPAAEGKSSFIDVRDIADAAAAALTAKTFDGKAFNLTGPEALSYAEAADILSSVLGREIAYQPVTTEAFVAMPFFVITVEAALRSLDTRYEAAGATLGTGHGGGCAGHLVLFLFGAILCAKALAGQRLGT